MKGFLGHLKKYIIRGLLAIIPLALTYFAIKIFYTTIDQRALSLLDRVTGFSFPEPGIIIVLISLYILGLIAGNVVGKKAFGLIEKITNYIPLIKTTYKIGLQLGSTLSLPEKKVFKQAYLLNTLRWRHSK